MMAHQCNNHNNNNNNYYYYYHYYDNNKTANWIALERLPGVLEKMGDFRGAVRACRAALVIDPTHKDINHHLQNLLQVSGNSRSNGGGG